MQSWAAELLDSMVGICEVLDRGDPSRPYATALAAQTAKLADPRLTPSARLLAELSDTGESFFDLALRMSTMHKAYFRDLHTSNPQRLAELSTEAQESLAGAARYRGYRPDFVRSVPGKVLLRPELMTAWLMPAGIRQAQQLLAGLPGAFL